MHSCACSFRTVPSCFAFHGGSFLLLSCEPLHQRGNKRATQTSPSHQSSAWTCLLLAPFACEDHIPENFSAAVRQLEVWRFFVHTFGSAVKPQIVMLAGPSSCGPCANSPKPLASVRSFLGSSTTWPQRRRVPRPIPLVSLFDRPGRSGRRFFVSLSPRCLADGSQMFGVR